MFGLAYVKSVGFETFPQKTFAKIIMPPSLQVLYILHKSICFKSIFAK